MAVARHLRMTKVDKDRKIARQFQRRMNAKAHHSGRMEYKLGTKEYWAQYNYFFELQQGRCAICKKLWDPDSKRRMHLDHNHETMVFRGLLCFSCNHKLGFVEKYFKPIMAYLGWEIHNDRG